MICFFFRISMREPFASGPKATAKNQEMMTNILAKLQNTLEQNNQLIQTFKSAVEFGNYNNLQDLSLCLHADTKPKHFHRGQYNDAVLNDVAIIIPGADDGSRRTGNRDIMLNLRSGELQ